MIQDLPAAVYAMLRNLSLGTVATLLPPPPEPHTSPGGFNPPPGGGTSGGGRTAHRRNAPQWVQPTGSYPGYTCPTGYILITFGGNPPGYACLLAGDGTQPPPPAGTVVYGPTYSGF